MFYFNGRRLSVDNQAIKQLWSMTPKGRVLTFAIDALVSPVCRAEHRSF